MSNGHLARGWRRLSTFQQHGNQQDVATHRQEWLYLAGLSLQKCPLLDDVTQGNEHSSRSRRHFSTRYQLMKKGRHGALAWLRQATGFDGPIVFVMGNNNFNHYPYDEVIESMRAEAHEHDVHFLHNEVAIVEGIEFIGTPLFTNIARPMFGIMRLWTTP